MNYQITNYNKELQSSLVSAYIQTFAAEPWNEHWQANWVEDRLNWLEQVPNFKGLIALDENKVIGTLLGYAKPFRGRLDFEIVELFVTPEQQQRGIGKALVKRLEVELSVKQSGVVHLLTAKGSSAETFYQSIGYQRSDKLCFMVHRL